MLHYEEGSDSDEYQDRQAPVGFAIDFREQIGGRDVEGDAAGKGQGVAELALQRGGEEDAGEGGSAEQSGGEEGVAAALSAGQDEGGNGETFGELVQKDGEKDDRAEPGGNEEAGGDGDAVKKSVNCKAEKDGVAGVGVAYFCAMSFLAEVEVRG